MPATWIVVVHYAATLFMAGVIWIVQVVHYPLFARVGAAGYAAYQGAHVRLITYVVLPAMLVELATAAAWAWAARGGWRGRGVGERRGGLGQPDRRRRDLGVDGAAAGAGARRAGGGFRRGGASSAG